MEMKGLSDDDSPIFEGGGLKKTKSSSSGDRKIGSDKGKNN